MIEVKLACDSCRDVTIVPGCDFNVRDYAATLGHPIGSDRFLCNRCGSDPAAAERMRIVHFLQSVFERSTHGASGLFERAIAAVRDNNMRDPSAICHQERR
jgi:hypothetical protein